MKLRHDRACLMVCACAVLLGCSGSLREHNGSEQRADGSTEDGAPPFAREIHVSPEGDDSADGTSATPLATLQRARDVARSVGPPGTTIYLADGVHRLTEPLVLEESDSGVRGSPITWRAAPGAHPVITGGARLGPWTNQGGNVWSASAQGLDFRTVFIGDTRATRARHPNTEEYDLVRWNADPADPMYTHTPRYIAVQLSQVGEWNSHAAGVELVIRRQWDQSILRIASVGQNVAEVNLEIQEPEGMRAFVQAFPMKKVDPSLAGVRREYMTGQPQYFHFENAREFLDAESEWYLDRATDTVYLMAVSDPNATDVVVPRIEALVRVAGAHDVRFIGLELREAGWAGPNDEGYAGLQAGVRLVDGGRPANLPAAIELEHAARIRFERNAIHTLGSAGLSATADVDALSVEGNAFYDIGGGAIMLGTTDCTGGCAPTVTNTTVRNNYFKNIGREYYGSAAVVATYTRGTLIENNEIADVSYTGISVGWGWSKEDHNQGGNVVRANDIHGVMNQSCDGAGIYTLSNQSPGTLIERNFVHDVVLSPFACHNPVPPVYLDENSGYITVRGNVAMEVPFDGQTVPPAYARTVFINGASDPAMIASNVLENNDGVDPAVTGAGIAEEYRDIEGLVP